MNENDPDAGEPRNLVCPHFLACRGVRYDSTDADAGHTLEKVIVHVRPSDGNGFPFRISRLFLFAQLYGTPGDHTVHIQMLRIGVVDDEEVIQTRRDFGAKTVAISGDNYVECFAFPLLDVWFTEPGIYEFQMWTDGPDEPLARERVQARSNA